LTVCLLCLLHLCPAPLSPLLYVFITGPQELGNWKGFIAFYALRLCLAPLLESMLLVDRLQFLEEAGGGGGGHDTALLPIFEPSLSPRNFVLTARRAADTSS
jgi:hypothetical protein